ncbi:hypothetical protein N0V93_003994 [Gnomoniopsis smithogilvyi]|uniref:BTB domain-containing protein n=1 Tax=Gnomoniopsis smithogilvyi TaxID=1191159 RepID=A0A9W8YXP1_9PEZI|nr:hypothetical protein N0V93_003994 [Gnomoniopsis smithogilvyi]
MDPPRIFPSLLSAEGLWGDSQFADATIVFGEATWKVHRWVICRQSDYFMRALEGEFKGVQNKTIVLVNELFNAEDIDSLLKFLYTNKLQDNQHTNILKTFAVARFFMVENLRAASILLLKNDLVLDMQEKKWPRLYKFFEFTLASATNPGTDIEKTLIHFTAIHAQTIINEPAMKWDTIAQAYPSFANKVLKQLFPKVYVPVPQPQPQPQPQQLTAARGSASADARRPNTQKSQTTQRGAARSTPY